MELRVTHETPPELLTGADPCAVSQVPQLDTSMLLGHAVQCGPVLRQGIWDYTAFGYGPNAMFNLQYTNNGIRQQEMWLPEFVSRAFLAQVLRKCHPTRSMPLSQSSKQ